MSFARTLGSSLYRKCTTILTQPTSVVRMGKLGGTWWNTVRYLAMWIKLSRRRLAMTSMMDNNFWKAQNLQLCNDAAREPKKTWAGWDFYEAAHLMKRKDGLDKAYLRAQLTSLSSGPRSHHSTAPTVLKHATLYYFTRVFNGVWMQNHHQLLRIQNLHKTIMV